MASDDNVGFTKKPVQPAATPNTRSTADRTSFRLELHIISHTSRTKDLGTLLKQCRNCSREIRAEAYLWVPVPSCYTAPLCPRNEEGRAACTRLLGRRVSPI
jgi:hypothetical protein